MPHQFVLTMPIALGIFTLCALSAAHRYEQTISCAMIAPSVEWWVACGKARILSCWCDCATPHRDLISTSLATFSNLWGRILANARCGNCYLASDLWLGDLAGSTLWLCKDFSWPQRTSYCDRGVWRSNAPAFQHSMLLLRWDF